MIGVVGLTPAWQQIMVFNDLKLDDVNRATEVHWCASGKVLNCGLAIHSLGGNAVTFSPAGGMNGEAMKRRFEKSGARAVWIDSTVETRVCTTVISQTDNRITELVENSRNMPQQELDAYLSCIEQAADDFNLFVLTGSLPEATDPNYYRSILEKCDKPAICDFRGPGLRAILDMNPLVVKPNRSELEMTLGRPLESETDLLAGMQELLEAGAQWVLVTQGGEDLYLASINKSYKYSSLAVPVVNAIGCGDCFTGGLAWALDAGMSVPDAVPFGIAAAADNLQQLLPAELNERRVRNLAAQVKRTEI
ncbi:Tagatose-6-phosphate kinase [Polystyrenella longa]|uniref:Tagatose-6-phosphate kinase n=1 Tax=Polystyrenella longa TaxID=2528007 RepID=A0A518CN63_9PLAN|nr:PfkB family carbohydrate kinase [Polystyrenella longa]QDU80660.1 Tagatose-6-phosphate kinase [Polystyrenella longa]